MKIKIKKKKIFYDIEKHGITQSLLSMFLECRKKARYYLEGWDSIYHKLALTEGSVGHAVLQFAYEDIMTGKLKTIPSKQKVLAYTKRVEEQWLAENKRADKTALNHLEYSLATMETTLPIYFDFYRKDLKEIRWLGLEEKFCIPYKLKDGRKTVLRGKKDGEFENNGLWLFETKFKSQINIPNLVDILTIDMQVFFYLRALKQLRKKTPEGVLYNIVRRTSLYQRKDENLYSFSKRLKQDIEQRPDFYFYRIPSSVTSFDLKKFEVELEGLLTDFINWWQGISACYKNTNNCIGKYGKCEFLPCCSNNNFSGFKKRKAVFKELEDF